MVLCIEAVHKLGWIHRDIKPDNFLLGADGHLKISDFGLAFDGKLDHCQTYYAQKRQELLDKYCIHVTGDEQDVAEAMLTPPFATESNRIMTPKPSQLELLSNGTFLGPFQNRRRHARSIVGTNQYMAPEIVLGWPYDARCDWWSLGILVYEIFYGHTPFFDGDRQRTKENIASFANTLDFPVGPQYGRPNCEDCCEYATPSEEALHFMQSLLADRDYRLGGSVYQYPGLSRRRDSGVKLDEAKHVKSYDADEVKSHSWFADMPWTVLHETTPPWVPNVQPGQSLTKYFEAEPDILTEDEFLMKRSRDKVLRDPELGPSALEERRRNAFYGFTYRRLMSDMTGPVLRPPRAYAVPTNSWEVPV